MAPEPNRRSEPAGSDTPWLVLGGVLLALLLLAAAVWAGAATNPALTGRGDDPVTVVLRVLTGQVPTTATQTAVTGALLVLLVLSGAVLGLTALRHRRGRSRVDYKARWLASSRDVHRLTQGPAAADSERLGAGGAGVGVTLGTHLPSSQRLWASWESVQVWVMGPRSGKTTCVCIPQVVEPAGPVIATSNKPDLVDATRGPRSETGVVWVHDVQDIIGEPASWWWDPLSFVVDLQTAEKLADVFISSATSAGDTQDAYFKSAGKELLARLLLAAALAGRPITDVQRWANTPRPSADDNPARLLKDHGQDALALALDATQRLTEKQRDGVYGTMRPWIGVLANRQLLPWITDPAGTRPHFDPQAFISSTDTVYLISKEGEGSARALTAALTMAILTAAEAHASRQPTGRLSPALTAVLDEAANVCRWRALPDLYSHYGSRGIVLSAFFQSWAQGVEAYGATGIDKLWSAANVRVVGPGLAEEKFLTVVSSLIGDYDRLKRTSSQQRTTRSTTTSVQRQRLFDVSDLAALPLGRAVALISGVPAVLLQLDHHSTRPYAGSVTASQAVYETARARPLGLALESAR
ncbi:type IV secretory system conjugative DNA transfer family protein [Aquipuribacter hungaricus]|uniref:type IV secretory system conjugative DNA transfer family protein n=1 Tax=Aquipuribacter hungaricus TaxID=545624 RepID=UPI0030EE4B9B